ALAATVLVAEDFSGKVVGISDGDTIRVLHEGRAERVRLWGVDAPESGHPGARGPGSSPLIWRCVRQDRNCPRARHRSLQAHGGRNHPAGRTEPEPGTGAKLALEPLHTCQDTFYVCLRLAKRRNTLVTINGAATSIIRSDRVLERIAGVAILLD